MYKVLNIGPDSPDYILVVADLPYQKNLDITFIRTEKYNHVKTCTLNRLKPWRQPLMAIQCRIIWHVSLHACRIRLFHKNTEIIKRACVVWLFFKLFQFVASTVRSTKLINIKRDERKEKGKQSRKEDATERKGQRRETEKECGLDGFMNHY